MTPTFRAVAMTVLLAAIVHCDAAAQITAATLSGAVADDGGAALPGAIVVVASTETGLQRAAITRSDGSYLTAGLPPGVYEIRATLDGFAAAILHGIRASRRRAVLAVSVPAFRSS